MGLGGGVGGGGGEGVLDNLGHMLCRLSPGGSILE